MNIHEYSEHIAELMLRKAVNHWAKKCPKVWDMSTHTFVNGKRYLIHICRSDYKDFKPTGAERSEDIGRGMESNKRI